MNTIKNFISVTLLTLAMVVCATAQFISGPATGAALLTTTPFFIPGLTTTSVVSTAQFNIPVGQAGVGFQLEMGATNAASTTNCTITLEGTVDGTYWIDYPTAALPVLSIPQNGTSPYTCYTNINAAAASVHIGNMRYLRVKTIQNTNVLGIFITNFTWSIKQ